jgi:Tol biopolymer transport system component
MFGRKRSHKPHTPRRQMAPSVRLSLERLEAREVPSTLQPLTDPEPTSVFAQGNQWAGFSADGHFVAFEHDHSIFVRDNMTGATNQVDVAVDGGLPNGASEAAAISATGRFIAFWSYASNLVANDTNGLPDVFVRDMQTGTTILASIAADGSQLAINDPGNLSISADGQFVAFDGVFEQEQGRVYLFNQGTGAATAIGLGSDSLISANGLFIAYAIQPNDADTGWSLYNRESNATRVIDPLGESTILGVHAYMHVRWMSADGQQVAVQQHYAFAPGYLGCIDYFPVTYIYDVQAAAYSDFAITFATSFSLSADGRSIAFVTLGLAVPGYASPYDQVFILDRETGSYTLVSEGLNGNPDLPVISPDGRSVVFWNAWIEFKYFLELPTIHGDQLFLYVGDDTPSGGSSAAIQPSSGSPQAETAAPHSVFAPMLAFTLPHSGGTANLIAWDLTGDGTADFVILTRRVHQRWNVTAFDMTTHKPLLHFGLTRPQQIPQFFNVMVHLNRDSLLGLLSAARPLPVEPFGLFSTALLLTSA